MFPLTQYITWYFQCHNQVWEMAWYTTAVDGEMPKGGMCNSFVVRMQETMPDFLQIPVGNQTLISDNRLLPDRRSQEAFFMLN
jgi:hypothetical protein